MLLDRKKRIFKPAHELPGKYWLNYIILPYGEFYEKTRVFLDASPGDTLRFFNGPDVEIEDVFIIKCDRTCDFLCKMRYGITWDIAFKKWLSYARLEGHGRDILNRDRCLLVVFRDEQTSK